MNLVNILELLTISNILILLIGVVIGFFVFKILNSDNKELAVFLINAFLEALDTFDKEDLNKRDLLIWLLNKLSEWDMNTEKLEKEIKAVYFQQALEEDI